MLRIWGLDPVEIGEQNFPDLPRISLPPPQVSRGFQKFPEISRGFQGSAFSCAMARCDEPDSARYSRHSRQQSLTCSTCRSRRDEQKRETWWLQFPLVLPWTCCTSGSPGEHPLAAQILGENLHGNLSCPCHHGGWIQPFKWRKKGFRRAH